MDLQLYLRVLWRFRFLLLLGFLVAVALAFLSFVRVSFDEGLTSPRVSYRQGEVWASSSLLLVTQPGFPEGQPAPVVDVNRLSQLAVLYTRIANSDDVRKIAARGGGLPGGFGAETVVEGAFTLPMLRLRSSATNAADAVTVAERATNALRVYVSRQQDAAGIPPNRRTVLKVLNEPRGQVYLAAGRSKTLSIVVFLAVMTATIGLAFILENLRPRIRPVPRITAEPPAMSETRRSRSA